MEDERIPKALLFGQLSHGIGSKGNHSSYTNKLKTTLRSCGINPYSFEQHAKNRSTWRSLCKQGLYAAELKRTEHLVAKRIRRHILLWYLAYFSKFPYPNKLLICLHIQYLQVAVSLLRTALRNFVFCKVCANLLRPDGCQFCCSEQYYCWPQLFRE